MITTRRSSPFKIKNDVLVLAIVVLAAVITVAGPSRAVAGVPIPPNEFYSHPAGKYVYAGREAAGETNPANDADVSAVYGAAWLRVTDEDPHTLKLFGLMDSLQGDSLWHYLISTVYRRTWMQPRVRTASEIRADDPELYAYLAARGLRPDDVTLQVVGRNSLQIPKKSRRDTSNPGATARAQHTEEAMLLRFISELEYAFDALKQGESIQQIEQNLKPTSDVTIETNRLIGGVVEQKPCTVNRDNPNCGRYAGTLDYVQDPRNPAMGTRAMKKQMLEGQKGRLAHETPPFYGPRSSRPVTMGPTPPPEVYAAKAMVGQNGGIDFSDVELSYLSDRPKDGQHTVDYRFSARPAATPDDQHPAGIGQVQQTSDAFFTWLALSPDKFWVNLNPDEPNRIIDPGLGSTAAGKIMLQADLQLKKDVGKVINPNTRSGRDFWNRVRRTGNRACLSMRVWVVPSPATVYQTEHELYILKAPLNVKTETNYLKAKPAGYTASTCPKADQATEHANEALYRQVVIPKVISAVNSDPQYAALRHIYRARIAAEWIRDHSRTEDTGYNSVINSDDVRQWRLRGRWTPLDVYHAYVKSYRQGEFKIKKRIHRGHHVYVQTYTYGGVDFSKVPVMHVTTGQFDKNWSRLAIAAHTRDDRPAKVSAGRVWFGAEATVGQPRHVQQPSRTSPVGIVIIVVGVLALAGLIISLLRRRTGSGRRWAFVLAPAVGILLIITIVLGAGSHAMHRTVIQRSTSAPPTLSQPRTTTSSAPAPSAPPPRPTIRPTTTRHRSQPRRPHPPRWTAPRRGHRPATSLLALTWHRGDHAELQKLDQFSFAFAVPNGFSCIDYPDINDTVCGRSSHFGKKDSYLVMYVWKCGCTIHEVQETVNRELDSRHAYSNLIPVDPYTRVRACPAAGPIGGCRRHAGRIAHKYWLSRIFDANGDHRPDHHLLVYAQAKSHADDIALRKTIGDIYDATR